MIIKGHEGSERVFMGLFCGMGVKGNNANLEKIFLKSAP